MQAATGLSRLRLPRIGVTGGSAVALAIAGGCTLMLVLRLPWLGAALGIDEGGLAMVALDWTAGQGSLYGGYWIDRSPVLIALFRAALVGGDAGVRVLGAAAGACFVALATVTALRLAGRRAAFWTAGIAAVLSGSAALQYVFTTAETLAVVPSTASVLLLLHALDGDDRRRTLAAAGALATTALLVKQSFICAGAAGAALLALRLWRREPAAWRWTGAYASGAVVPLALIAAWHELLWRPDTGSVWHALWGFRLQAGDELAGDLTGAAFLALPAAASGLALALAWAPRGLRVVSARPGAATLLGAWAAGGLVGVLASGSHWPHYLVQLAPFAAIAGGIGLASAPRRPALATAATLAALALGGLAVSAVATRQVPHQQSVTTVAGFLRAHAQPGDTMHVVHARANLLHASGLRSPLAHHWSLMLRAMPEARAQLHAGLASDRRPTWLVVWQSFDSWGLDPRGELRRTAARHYVPVATVCRRRVLLRRDVRRPVSDARIDAPCARDSWLFG